MLFSVNSDEGVIFEGTGVVVLNDSLIFSDKKKGTFENHDKPTG